MTEHEWICITGEYGIVVRRDALNKHGLTERELFDLLKVKHALGQSQTIQSFGPHFGGEGLQGVIELLQSVGLVYWDDFVEVVVDVPPWLTLGAK